MFPDTNADCFCPTQSAAFNKAITRQNLQAHYYVMGPNKCHPLAQNCLQISKGVKTKRNPLPLSFNRSRGRKTLYLRYSPASTAVLMGSTAQYTREVGEPQGPAVSRASTTWAAEGLSRGSSLVHTEKSSSTCWYEPSSSSMLTGGRVPKAA